MALIVETGTGSAAAESYCSVAYFLSYHAARGNAAAAVLTTAATEEALRRATDYMLQTYRSRWQGYRRINGQALDWPRTGIVIDQFVIVDFNIVPIEVQNACAELALKASTATLLADTEQQVLREKIGPLEFEYDKSSPQTKRYKSIDAMLTPYLCGSNSGVNVRLERA